MNAPITVDQFPYCAIIERDIIYRVRLSLLDQPEPILNSFIGHTIPLVLGRALVLACGAGRSSAYIGFDWHIGETADIGWLTFRGHRLPALPRHFVSSAFGHEMGIALLQMGVLLEVRRDLKIAIGLLNRPLAEAG